MKLKKQLDGLNYRQVQRRNSESFKSLTSDKQKIARQDGYKNVGWENIRQSWNILQKIMTTQPVDFIEFAINKAEKNYQNAKEQGDLINILKTGKTVIQAIKLKYQ